MITAGITATVAAILSLFGVKPGAYLVGVAIGVKVTLVAVGLVVGARIMRRRAAAQVSPPAEASTATASEGAAETQPSDG
jgi:hypothetical protein